MTRKWKWIWIAPLAVVGLTAFIALGGFVVQQLWNWLLPPLFGFPTITVWQALGLLLLSRILVGGFGHGSSRPHSSRRIADRVADRVADRMAERWDAMTPEQRERFRERMRGRWGLGPPTSEGTGQ
jgi:hypothetical protein